MKKIIISRTDNLGDVVLTLPLAGIIKSQFPDSTVYFIGKTYTRPIIEGSVFIDHFLDREDILKNPNVLTSIQADAIVHVYPDKEIARAAKTAGIVTRIGTSHRIFHWFYCNKRVSFSRKKSSLHEAQLNVKLLAPLGIHTIPELKDIPSYYGFTKIGRLSSDKSPLLQPNKFHLVLHPKSKGSAREWPSENYYQLANRFNKSNYQILITGTATEGDQLKIEKPELFELEHVTDCTGKLNLSELISLIKASDGLIACSTGPLHIGAALGKNVLGIFPPMRPIHPGRWAPIGLKAGYLVMDKNCDDCRKTQQCHCIQAITVAQVIHEIQKW